tara:strand:+ start:348 stop:1019 length:672 start_codon:yes stop_codon:yes gene_type:complete
MKQYFLSTLFRKMLAGVTGLFLVTFLLGHLFGNLQLILLTGEVAKQKFNAYALFMTTNPAVKLLSYITYSAIILHTLLTVGLALKARKARPIAYEVSSGNKNSSWSSKNMALLGTLILLFLVVHLRSFWYEMHFGSIPFDAWGNKDLYTVTVSAFKESWYTIFYIISMIVLGFHLKHGIESGFQTIGLKNKKFAKLIKLGSLTLSIFISFSFASIPIIIYFRS